MLIDWKVEAVSQASPSHYYYPSSPALVPCHGQIISITMTTIIIMIIIITNNIIIIIIIIITIIIIIIGILWSSPLEFQTASLQTSVHLFTRTFIRAGPQNQVHRGDEATVWTIMMIMMIYPKFTLLMFFSADFCALHSLFPLLFCFP